MTIDERECFVRSFYGKTVSVKIDRPLGYIHKKENHTLIYPLNYGYIPGILSGDGEDVDVYLLGVDEPVEEYECVIIGAVFRKNDVEDKLIAAPKGFVFTKIEAERLVSFQERFFDSVVEMIPEMTVPHIKVGEKEDAEYYERPGAYVLPQKDGLTALVKTKGCCCFIGGGRERGETDLDCMIREVREETGCAVTPGKLFASAEEYKPDQTDIGYFHPFQHYYFADLGEKICEPCEPDHALVWVKPEEIIDSVPIRMQRLTLEALLKMK